MTVENAKHHNGRLCCVARVSRSIGNTRGMTAGSTLLQLDSRVCVWLGWAGLGWYIPLGALSWLPAVETSVPCAFAGSCWGMAPWRAERTQLCAEQQWNPDIVFSLLLTCAGRATQGDRGGCWCGLRYTTSVNEEIGKSTAKWWGKGGFNVFWVIVLWGIHLLVLGPSSL